MIRFTLTKSYSVSWGWINQVLSSPSRTLAGKEKASMAIKNTVGISTNMRNHGQTSASKATSTPIATAATSAMANHDYGLTSSSGGTTGGYQVGGTNGTGAQVMEFNRNMMLQQQSYNSAEAQKNRDWQEYMSNTAYQRAMEDMKKAGLNPILAYQQGGASTPAGGQATSAMAAGQTDTESYSENWGYNSAESYNVLAKVLSDLTYALISNYQNSEWRPTVILDKVGKTVKDVGNQIANHFASEAWRQNRSATNAGYDNNPHREGREWK